MARAKLWAASNQERRFEIAKASSEKLRERSREKRAMQVRAQRAAQPEKYRRRGIIAAHRRRVMTENAGGILTKPLIDLMQKIALGCCTYCGKPTERLTLDHVEPIGKGGRNDWSNIIMCCKSCNSSKQQSEISDWVFSRFGEQGVHRSVLFLKAINKAVKRLFPELYKLKKKMMLAEYGIEILEM